MEKVPIETILGLKVWKFQNFLSSQILRETNFKIGHFCSLQALKFAQNFVWRKIFL